MEITVAAAEVLLSKPYFTALARRLELEEKSRRNIPDWMVEVLFAYLAANGVIRDGNGKRIPIPDNIIEQAFNGDEGSFKSLSEALIYAHRPRQRRTKRTLLLRMQLFDAIYRILGKPIDPSEGADLYD